MYWYWYSLGFAAILLTSIILSLSESPQTTTLSADLQKIANQRPDAFMEGVHQRTFNEDGTLETTLKAHSLLDFGTRADAQLEAPRLWLKRETTSWYIEGDYGELSANREIVNILDNASAQRYRFDETSMTLSGNQLRWDQTTDLVTSPTTTKMVHGRAVSIGDELIINLNTSEYSLGDKVRTQWRSISSSDY